MRCATVFRYPESLPVRRLDSQTPSKCKQNITIDELCIAVGEFVDEVVECHQGLLEILLVDLEPVLPHVIIADTDEAVWASAAIWRPALGHVPAFPCLLEGRTCVCEFSALAQYGQGMEDIKKDATWNTISALRSRDGTINREAWHTLV